MSTKNAFVLMPFAEELSDVSNYPKVMVYFDPN